MLEELSDVALNLFELVEVQVGIGDGKDIASLRLFVNENTAAFADNLLLHLENAFAFEHDGEDVAGGNVARIILLDELAQERFSSVFLNGLDDRGGGVKNRLPMGDETFAFARAVIELVLPAVLADVHAAEFRAFVREESVERLLIDKGLAAGFTRGGAGLDVPFVHVLEIKTQDGGRQQAVNPSGFEFSQRSNKVTKPGIKNSESFAPWFFCCSFPRGA